MQQTLTGHLSNTVCGDINKKVDPTIPKTTV